MIHFVPLRVFILAGVATAALLPLLVVMGPKGEVAPLLAAQNELVTRDQRCIECHRRENLGVAAIDEYTHSAHRVSGVGCSSCHGDFHETTFDKRVPAEVCGRCHQEETEAFLKGRHSKAAASLIGHPEFVSHSSGVAALGCLSCHKAGLDELERADAKPQGRCDMCHSGHSYKVEPLRAADACKTCHTGHATPQTELVANSKHRACFGDGNSCLHCHDAHHDSLGITLGTVGNGATLSDAPFPFPVERIAPQERHENREAMLSRCRACHLPNDARNALAAADRIKVEADESLRELYELVEEAKGGRHSAVAGQTLVDQGKLGALLFDATKIHHPQLWKAAYHQAPSALVEARRNLDRIREEIKQFIENPHRGTVVR